MAELDDDAQRVDAEAENLQQPEDGEQENLDAEIQEWPDGEPLDVNPPQPVVKVDPPEFPQASDQE